MAFKFFKPWTWFSSKERKDALKFLTELNTNIKKLADNIPINTRPYKSIRLIGSTLIVVLNDGIVLSKEDQIEDDVRRIAAYTTEDQILDYFTVKTTKIQVDPSVQEEEQKNIIKNNWGILNNHPDFELEGEDVYF